MNITVTYFGKLIELTGRTLEDITIEESSVVGVKTALEKAHPAFKNRTYQLAENNSILQQEDRLKTRALDVFPPFSGG